jgi:hypothetical protein
MATAQNKVLSGLYDGKIISREHFIKKNNLTNVFEPIYYLKLSLTDKYFIIIDEVNVQSVEIINKDGLHTEVGSSVVGGLVGGAFLGGAGLIAGAAMGGQNSINLLCITWKDGQKSLIEVNCEIFSMLNTIAWNIQNGIISEKLTRDEIIKNENSTNRGCFWTCLILYSPILLLITVACPLLGLVLIMFTAAAYKPKKNRKLLEQGTESFDTYSN